MDTGERHSVNLSIPSMYVLKLTLNEIIKMVHQMKSEMNMIVETSPENEQLNFKRIFGELTPQLVKISDKGYGYRISINEQAIALSHWDTNKHGLRLWGVYIETTKHDHMRCVVECEPGQHQHLLKFIPLLKSKIDECCDSQ